jgi:uncharacterized damage-inducible protein DinB
VRITDIHDFLDYYEGIRARTARVVDCIPPERFDWAPAEGKFSFADLVRHLAGIERFMFAENVAGRASRYPGHGPELASGREAVLDYFERLHAEAMAIFATLDAEALQRRCSTPAGIQITTWKWLRAMVEHEVHHRGQLYLMLGQLGVETPPLYGLTSEQVRERSRPHPARDEPSDGAPLAASLPASIPTLRSEP